MRIPSLAWRYFVATLRAIHHCDQGQRPIMRLRIDLACGQWRVIECDKWQLDGALTRFTRDGNTVLIAPTNHLSLVEPLGTNPVPDARPVHAFLAVPPGI